VSAIATASMLAAEIINGIIMLLELQAKLARGEDVTQADLDAARQRNQAMLNRVDAAVAAQDKEPTP